jgi:hypothetical protein
MQAVLVITTSSVEAVQGALDMVQRNVAVPFKANPVTPDVAEAGLVIVAVPEINDHAPVPTIGVLPANVAVLMPLAGYISVPALAMVGRAFTTIVLVAVTLPQTPAAGIVLVTV